ncbi:MAG: DoxX family protein [Pirellula sp.]|jgi:uncharacterized membrane protein YphA (DoxX/SURF4 family)|nr:DoxX family protein [Pirellula sp.]
MLLRKARLSFIAIIALVALRFVIGFHFYMEGSAKVKDGNFSSAGFLAAAKGPLADKFHSLIPDYDGLFRLPELREFMMEPKAEEKVSEEKAMVDKSPDETSKKKADEKPARKEPLVNEKLDKNKVFAYKRLFEYIDSFAGQTSALYGFTEEQKKASEMVTTEGKERLNAVVEEWGNDISKYLKGFERVTKNNVDEMRNNVTGMRKQKDSIESEWKALARAPLADIDRILWDIEKGVNALATPSQVGKDKSYAKLRMPDAGPIDVRLVDKYLPIFDMTVGILLMLGLLTPVAALAAGIFLASVVLTQFPGYPGSQPTYYQAIEMIACFVLAFADAGRYAGLDFLPWSFWNRGKSVEVG